MAIPKIFGGHRAICYISKPGEPTKAVGLFSDISYSLTYTAAPADILGRFSAAEVDYTGVELVDISATGWRIIGQGPHAAAAVPKWQDLLLHDYLTLQVLDRATKEVIATIEKVRPLGYSTSIAAKQLTQIPVRYVGIIVSDESGANSESAGASDLE